jgi:hypothetical protein
MSTLGIWCPWKGIPLNFKFRVHQEQNQKSVRLLKMSKEKGVEMEKGQESREVLGFRSRDGDGEVVTFLSANISCDIQIFRMNLSHKTHSRQFIHNFMKMGRALIAYYNHITHFSFVGWR